MATIRIPTPLRPYAEGQSEITVEGESVAEALDELTRRYPGLREHLFHGSELRSFVNVFLGEEDVRYLDGLGTSLQPGDELRIIPSIAGG